MAYKRLGLVLLFGGLAVFSQDLFRQMSMDAERTGLAEPYRGIFAAGAAEPGLFPLKSTGVSTEPVRKAAEAFVAALTQAQRAKAMFPVDDPEWRKWMNQHFYIRQGVGFEEMDATQRDAAFNLMRASLSARGLKLTRDIMKLNETLGELNNNDFQQYGEWKYWITMMGMPSKDQPWGWQLDGHHAIINYFVLGDQVVMTPLFVGSEPVIATSGKYKGIAILQAEQDQGFAFLRGLNDAQRKKAVLTLEKPENNNVGEAFKDNVNLDYAGVAAKELNPAQRKALVSLIRMYIDNMDEGHARVKMQDVERHLDRTHFAWIGDTEKSGVFYYRIHSPVVLVEFDHQRLVGIRHLSQNRLPDRSHIHVVVRTPNGNDYGKDLLRQHYQRSKHGD
jgi:hypothetical protein